LAVLRGDTGMNPSLKEAQGDINASRMVHISGCLFPWQAVLWKFGRKFGCGKSEGTLAASGQTYLPLASGSAQYASGKSQIMDKIAILNAVLEETLCQYDLSYSSKLLA